MQTRLHYSQAPITEALIDLRVVLPAGFSVEDLLRIHEDISSQYPSYEPIYFESLTVQTGPDMPNMQVNTTRQHIGFRFRDISGLNIFQATLHGFTFNRLKPYETWGKFSSDARRAWEIYKAVCGPEVVTRAAVRYINQINIPSKDTLNLQDYLRTIPEVSPKLTQNQISTFFLQLQIPQEDLNCMLIINETLAPPAAPNVVTIILDIDLFRQQVWQSSDKEIWEFMEKLRYRKNDVFKASITEKTEELIS